MPSETEKTPYCLALDARNPLHISDFANLHMAPRNAELKPKSCNLSLALTFIHKQICGEQFNNPDKDHGFSPARFYEYSIICRLQ